LERATDADWHIFMFGCMRIPAILDIAGSSATHIEAGTVISKYKIAMHWSYHELQALREH